MNYWLLKSEPNSFSIDDLKKLPKQTDHWDGIRNYQARNFMRDDMQINDQAFFYHSSCKKPGIVGIVKIVSKAYTDFTALDPESKYYDPRSTDDNPRWVMVDVKFIKKLPRIISLQELREIPKLTTMQILRRGNRLSITPVSNSEWKEIHKAFQLI